MERETHRHWERIIQKISTLFVKKRKIYSSPIDLLQVICYFFFAHGSFNIWIDFLSLCLAWKIYESSSFLSSAIFFHLLRIHCSKNYSFTPVKFSNCARIFSFQLFYVNTTVRLMQEISFTFRLPSGCTIELTREESEKIFSNMRKMRART